MYSTISCVSATLFLFNPNNPNAILKHADNLRRNTGKGGDKDQLVQLVKVQERQEATVLAS